MTIFLSEKNIPIHPHPKLNGHSCTGFISTCAPLFQNILDGLVRLGHNITMSDSAGSVVQGILQRQEGNITANSDFRKHGYPDGY